MNKVILIYGKRGSGKSTLAKRIISHFKRVIVFDPLSEYAGDTIVNSLELFAETVTPLSDSDAFTIVCRFVHESLEETTLAYDYAARIVWDIGDILLVLEETEMFLDSFNKDSFINYLISFGRHRNVSLVGIGRRPAEIAVKLRSQFTSVFSFTQSEPRDLYYFEQLGFDTAELSTLEQFEFSEIGETLEELEHETTFAERDIFE